MTLVILFTLLPSAALGQERIWFPGEGREEENEQKTPEGMREIQALGRKGEDGRSSWKGQAQRGCGFSWMSTWHSVAFILVLCLFHHFYGLVCRHLLKGLSHLDLIEIMQPFPSPNVFLSQWLYKCSICDVIVLFQIFFPKLKTRVIQNIWDNGLNVTLRMTNSLFPKVCISFSYLVVYLWLEVEAPKVGGCTVKRTERWRELLLL